MRVTISLLVGALVAVVGASNVVELTPDNFDAVVGKGAPALVEFFAPWCGHCKNLAPVWEQLADAFDHVKDKVVIAKVDADGVGRPLGQTYGVTGFPTLKWFDAQGVESKYEEGRDLETLVAFVSKQTGLKSKLPVKPPSSVKTLDIHDFDDVVLSLVNKVFITFTAPWCGHCKSLKPVWENLATWFAPESNCVVANLDADDKKNKVIANKYGVQSFPTIKFFEEGENKTPTDYEGGRSEADLVDFLNEKCGTFRAVGGGLNSNAGLHAALDDLAVQFVAAAEEGRKKLLAEATSLASKPGNTEGSKHYVRAMEKLISGSENYIKKESERLGRLLSKNLSRQKLDELQIKANVLKAFTGTPEAKRETISREKAEL